MQTLKEFERSDEVVGLVFAISRQLIQEQNLNNIDWLLRKGKELSEYAGVLEGRANVAWGEHKAAEMAFKSVRDALMIANKGDSGTVTIARAEASRATQEAEVDVLAREQNYKNYATVANMCTGTVMFMQTTIRWAEKELSRQGFIERGQRRM